MLTHAQAERFAQGWIDAWNSHDIEAILAHYGDDFELATPYLVHTGTSIAGRLRGKDAIGAFWQAGLKRLPDLRFELIAVFTGVHSLALHYRGAQQRMAVETFEFDSAGRVIRTTAHYAE